VEDAFDAAPVRFRDIAHLIKVLVPEVVDHSVNRVEAGFDERVGVLLEIDLLQPHSDRALPSCLRPFLLLLQIGLVLLESLANLCDRLSLRATRIFKDAVTDLISASDKRARSRACSAPSSSSPSKASPT